MATEAQMAIINRYISHAPETLDELQEYVDTCAAINKDRNGDIYWIFGLMIRQLKPSAAADTEAPADEPEAKTEEKSQTTSDDAHTTISEPAKTDEQPEAKVVKGIRYTKDGDQIRAVYDASFVSLEESPSGLGKTPAEAFEALNAEREKRNATQAGDNAKKD